MAVLAVRADKPVPRAVVLAQAQGREGDGGHGESARIHSASGCARRACASMPVLKSTPVTDPWHTELRTRMPAPVPQHTSSPRSNEPSERNAPAVASSKLSGVRKGV
jgi:hypothetical protein